MDKRINLSWAGEATVPPGIIFDLPNAAPPPANANLQVPFGNNREDTAAAAVTHDNNKVQRYLLLACKSVMDN